MSNVVYTSISAIIESCKTTQDRIAMIDQMLNGMEAAILKATTTGQFSQYRLDTGQTKNEVWYRSMTELQNAYQALLQTQEMLRQRLNNNRVGRVIRLVPNHNFRGGR